MPLIRLTLLLCLLAVPFSGALGQAFKAYYKPAGDTLVQAGLSIRALADGGAVSAGVDGVLTNDYTVDGFYLLRTAADGSTVFYVRVPLSDPGLPQQVEQTPDGGFAVLTLALPSGRPTLTRFSSAGSLLWQRSYFLDGEAGAFLHRCAFAVRPDGGYHLVGTRNSGGAPKPVLLDLAGDGQPSGGRDLADSGIGFGLCAVSGGGWWAGTLDADYAGVSLHRLDAAGQTVLSARHRLQGPSTVVAALFAQSVSPAPNGGAHFVAVTSSDGGDNALLVALADASGSFSAVRTLAFAAGQTVHPQQLMEPSARAGGGLLVPVEYLASGAPESGLIVLDAGLNVAAHRAVASGSRSSEVFFAARETADGGSLMTGAVFGSGGDPDAMLWRTDANFATGQCSLESLPFPSPGTYAFAAGAPPGGGGAVLVGSASGTPPVETPSVPAAWLCGTAPGGGGTCQAPASVAFQALSAGSVTASWAAFSGAISYQLRYRTASGGWQTRTAPGTSFTITGLTAQTQYSFEIRSKCSPSGPNQWSGWTASSFATPGNEACQTPTGLQAQGASQNQIQAVWNSVVGATGYKARIREAGTLTWTETSPSNAQKSFGGLQPGTEYEVQVRSRCAANTESEWSASVLASTQFTSAADQLWTRNGAGQMTATLPQSVVGIGHANPQAALHVGDGTLHGGTVLFNGTAGAVPTATAGPQMFWAPEKAAFRVGSVDGSQWDNGNVGLNSVAFGKNATAGGENSVAIGYAAEAVRAGDVVIGLPGGLPDPAEFRVQIGRPDGGKDDYLRIVAQRSYAKSCAVETSETPNPSEPQQGCTQTAETEIKGVMRIDEDPKAPGCGGDLRVRHSTYTYCLDVRSSAAIGEAQNRMLLSAEVGTQALNIGAAGESPVLKIAHTPVRGAFVIGSLGVEGNASVSGNGGFGGGLTVAGDALVQGRLTVGTAQEAGYWLRAGANGLTVLENGNVGVGTDAPTHRLEVCGMIRATDVIAETGWCDYVFQPDYRLRSFDELRGYIQTHGHLPDVPSAAEVEHNGIRLAEMNAILLKKVEELTLYVLELEHRIQKGVQK